MQFLHKISKLKTILKTSFVFGRLLIENSNQLKRTMKLNIDSSVKCMKKLDRSLFKCDVRLPILKVDKNKYDELKHLLRAYVIDMANVSKKYRDLEQNDNLQQTHKRLLLDPEKFDTIDTTFTQNNLKNILENRYKFNSNEHFSYLDVTLSYDDLKFDDVIKSILPDEVLKDNLTAKSFSLVGHIAHFNLRSELLEYRYIIGN